MFIQTWSRCAAISLCVSALFINTTVSAATLDPPIMTSVAITDPVVAQQKMLSHKTIALMSLPLSSQQQHFIEQYRDLPILSLASLPTTVNLGMGKVPVLDQGVHGTCVTFAITAVLDALLNVGNQLSQLCSLELGETLADNSYYLSGWDGSMGSWVLDQFSRFGYVSVRDQTTKSCAGVYQYPAQDIYDLGVPISLSDYKRLSKNINDKFHVETLLNWPQRVEKQFYTAITANTILTKVKENLVAGNRLIFGVELVLDPNCNAGACATAVKAEDTWAITKAISNHQYPTGGHEMIIIGYDDNKTALDNEGKTHKGLLILRNSWGAEVGDKGNFYMTYDYFKKYTGEIEAIIPIQD